MIPLKIPVGKGPHFYERDRYIDYPFEEVMFRSDHVSKKIFRKFYDDDMEMEVHFSSRLFNDALLSGYEITLAEYMYGKSRS